MILLPILKCLQNSVSKVREGTSVQVKLCVKYDLENINNNENNFV